MQNSMPYPTILFLIFTVFTRRNLSLVFLIFLFIGEAVASENLLKHKRVVVLHSYHKGQKWNDDLSKGIEDILRDDHIEINFEFMDVLRFQSAMAFDSLAALYKEKYFDRKVDLIIPTDEEALDFVLINRDTLFPGAAVAYCGITFYVDRFWEPDLTGIIESVDLEANVELARSITPSLKEIFVIMDNTPTSTSLINDFITVLKKYSPEISFRFSGFVAIEQLLTDIGNLSENSVAFLVNYTNPNGGKILTQRESSRLIGQSSKVPVYSVWDSYMGQGVLGGKLISGYHHGKKTGEIALRILRGESAESIPVETSSQSQYIFDYSQLQKFGIEETELPEGTVILNKPDPLYEQYKRLIWTLFLGAVALTSIILVLSLNIAHRRRIEKSLKSYSDRLNFLHRLDQSILNNFSLENIDRQIFRPTLYRIQCDLIGIHLFEQETAPIWALALQQNKIDLPLSIPILVEEKLPKAIVTKRQSLILGEQERELMDKLFPANATSPFNRYLLLPLVYKKELLGIFYIANTDGRDIERHQKAVSQQIAHTMALAIQNHYLFIETCKHEAKLRHMSISIIEAQEQERKRISAELHDEFGQSLTAIGINFGVIKKITDKLQATAIAERVQEVEQAIELLSDQVHNLSLDLRPPMLDDLGLIPTFRWFANQFQQRNDIKILFSAENSGGAEVANQISVTMYRVLQEALNNVSKHAEATEVQVILDISTTSISLLVKDNGQGFDIQDYKFMEPGKSGLGLLGMQERVDLLNGYVSIESWSGQGTAIRAVVPARRN